MRNNPATIKNTYIEKKVDSATMFDINKTIMRCLVINLAMFGLGLYIYAGEDLPEGDPEPEKKPEKTSGKKPALKDAKPQPEPEKTSASKPKTVVKADDMAMINKIASWAASDSRRVLRARDGYAWEGDALSKFYAIVTEIQDKQ